MPTSWTKTNDVTTSYTDTVEQVTSYNKVVDGTVKYRKYRSEDGLLSEGGLRIVTQDGLSLVIEGNTVVYTGIEDIETSYGKVTDITTGYIEIEDIPTTYTKRGDTTTIYKKEGEKVTRYIPYGNNLKLGTESFFWIATEGKLYGLVLGKDVYTEIDDKGTVYNKVSNV